MEKVTVQELQELISQLNKLLVFERRVDARQTVASLEKRVEILFLAILGLKSSSKE